MGGILSFQSIVDLQQEVQSIVANKSRTIENHSKKPEDEKFPDLTNLPPEIGLAVLSHLNATDLCLAACIWNELAHDNLLWMRLCKNEWGYATVYRKTQDLDVSYRRLYLLLDEGSLTFSADCQMGMEYFFKHSLLEDSPFEIARFFHSTNKLGLTQLRRYLESRQDVLEHYISLQNFSNQFLPNALRYFFSRTLAANERGSYLHALLEKFARRFCECNPQLFLTPDTVYIVCFSLILLSVDLASPHVKNKMSKREFIRNVRRAVGRQIDDWCGHLYDNVYLSGHVAPV